MSVAHEGYVDPLKAAIDRRIELTGLMPAVCADFDRAQQAYTAATLQRIQEGGHDARLTDLPAAHLAEATLKRMALLEEINEVEAQLREMGISTQGVVAAIHHAHTKKPPEKIFDDDDRILAAFSPTTSPALSLEAKPSAPPALQLVSSEN